MGTACSTHNRDDKNIKNSGGKPKSKKLLGRLKCKGKYSIKMILKEYVMV
jgi:hypothetical protein